jgi:hypothetical protein
MTGEQMGQGATDSRTDLQYLTTDLSTLRSDQASELPPGDQPRMRSQTKVVVEPWSARPLLSSLRSPLCSPVFSSMAHQS